MCESVVKVWEPLLQHEARVVDQAELHTVSKPQSKQPKQNMETKQTETQKRETIEKYILILLLISGERDRLQLAMVESKTSK